MFRTILCAVRYLRHIVDRALLSHRDNDNDIL